MTRLISAIILLILVVPGCKKKERTVLPPGKAMLISPLNNEACTTGKAISETESVLLFEWKPPSNTESYNLTLKNLKTGEVIVKESKVTNLELRILKNTPYSWFVSSRSSQTVDIAQSDTWKFYNSGPGETSNAPFPAEATKPSMGQTATAINGKITLDWEGTDVDDDISNYEVYIGLNNLPMLLKSDVSESILNDVAVESGKTYFWKIVSRDSKGNTSGSAVFQFIVE